MGIEAHLHCIQKTCLHIEVNGTVPKVRPHFAAVLIRMHVALCTPVYTVSQLKTNSVTFALYKNILALYKQCNYI